MAQEPLLASWGLVISPLLAEDAQHGMDQDG